MNIREQIERLRDGRVPLSYAANFNAADTMEAMNEVVLHAERMLNDPSWEPHQINLKEALAKLEVHKGDTDE